MATFKRGDTVRIAIGRGLVGQVELIENGRVSVRITPAWRHFCGIGELQHFGEWLAAQDKTKARHAAGAPA